MIPKGFQIAMIICLLFPAANAYSSGMRTEQLGSWNLWSSLISDIAKKRLSSRHASRDLGLAERIVLEEYVAGIRRKLEKSEKLEEKYGSINLWRKRGDVYSGPLTLDECKDAREIIHIRCCSGRKFRNTLWIKQEYLMGGTVECLRRIRNSRRDPLMVSGGYNSDMKRIRLGPILDVPRFWEHDKFDSAISSVESENGDEIKDEILEINIFQIREQ